MHHVVHGVMYMQPLCNYIFTPSAASECDVDNGGCDHYCTETIDNYTCSCYPGYTLQLDGHTCTGKMVGICTMHTGNHM